MNRRPCSHPYRDHQDWLPVTGDARTIAKFGPLWLFDVGPCRAGRAKDRCRVTLKTGLRFWPEAEKKAWLAAKTPCSGNQIRPLEGRFNAHLRRACLLFCVECAIVDFFNEPTTL